MKKYIFITLLASSFAGCMGVPKINETPINTLVQNKDSNSRTLFSSSWWEYSNDQNLNHLITEILANNKDIKVAQLNIEKANSTLAMAKGANLSSFDLSASGSRTHILKNYVNTHLPIQDFQESDNMDRGTASLQGGYTLDLWGKFKALEKQAEYAQVANTLQKKWITLNISTSVANIYGNYILLSKEESILRNKLKIAEDIYKLQKFSYDTGLGDKESYLSAENNFREVQSSLETIKVNKHILKNSLNALNSSIESTTINNELSSIDNNSNVNFNNLIKTPDYIDSDTVVNRPDVKYYLAILNSQKEKLKSVKADFYPRFSIMGNLQYQALDVHHLIDANSTTFAFGPSLYLPLFNRNTLKQNYKIAGTDLNIFIENYNSQLISVFQGVNNDLMSLKLSNKQDNLNNSNFINSDKIYKNDKTLFELGSISKLNLLLSENNFLDAQLKNVESKYNIYQNQVNLINSLGGYYKNEVK